MSTRARVRQRIGDWDISKIVSAVSSRSQQHRFRAANAELASKDLIRTGRAAAGSLAMPLVEDTRRVAGYVPSDAIQEYAKSHFMVPTPSGQDVLYENTLPIEYAGETMPAAVVAADLATSTDTRERSAGLQYLEELREQWLDAT